MVFGLFGKKSVKRAYRPKKRHKKAPKYKSHKRVKMRPKPAKRTIRIVKHAKPVKRAKPIKAAVKTVAALSKTAFEKLDDVKAFELLKGARIPVVPHAFVKSEKDLADAVKKTGLPCVMKVCGEKFASASNVFKDITSLDGAAAAFKGLMKIKGAEKVLMQKQIGGVELIIGARGDPQFGHIVSLGIGGIYREILRDVAFRVVPLDLAQAKAMVHELKGFEILESNKVKLDALYEILMRVGKLAAENKLKEVSLNPVFCTPEGCWVAGARIVK